MSVSSHILDMSDKEREEYYARIERAAARRKAEKQAKKEGKKK